LLVFGISPALAQTGCDDPNTPIHENCTQEATGEPLYKTPTPQPELPNICPTGQPEGWGAVTPNPLWLSDCSDCVGDLYSTPDPLYTPLAPTPTGGAGVTPTAAVATPTPGGYGDYCLVVVDMNGNEEGTCERTKTVTRSSPNGGIEARIKVKTLDGQSHPQTVRFFYSGACLHEYNSQNNQHFGIHWYYYFKDYGNMQEVSFQEFCGGQGYGTCTTSSDGDIVKVTDNGTLHRLSCSVGGVFGSQANTANLYVSLDHAPFTEPTPAPTPGVSNCYEVNGPGGSEGYNEGLGIELPVVTLGASHCFTVNSFVLDLSLISFITGAEFTEVSFPGIAVCFREISFGELNFLGLNVDLDIFSMVMAAVVVLRFMYRGI